MKTRRDPAESCAAGKKRRSPRPRSLGGVVFAVLLGLSPVSVLCAPGPGAESPDWPSLWGEILASHSRSTDAEVGTRVDYVSLLAEPRWKQMLASLARAEPGRLLTRNETLAFWINAYNIFAIDLILQNYPVESIRDIGFFFRPVWKKPAGWIQGREYSLHEIEHEILRPMGEPRIHGAIVCASVSCPSLMREPFRAERMDEQLDARLRAWMRRPEKGLALDREGRRLRVSAVFGWFEDDFAVAGGVLSFVTRYAPAEDANWLRANAPDISIGYLDYDWSLND